MIVVCRLKVNFKSLIRHIGTKRLYMIVFGTVLALLL